MINTLFRDLASLYGKVIIESLILRYYRAASIELLSEDRVTVFFEVYQDGIGKSLTPYTLDNDDIDNLLDWLEYNPNTGWIDPIRIDWIKTEIEKAPKKRYQFSIPIVATNIYKPNKSRWHELHVRMINHSIHRMMKIYRNKDKIYQSIQSLFKVETYYKWNQEINHYFVMIVPLYVITT